MLSNTLNTNEVKNAAGAEVEFTHIRQEGREREFAQIGEVPSLPHRLLIGHQEIGSGLKLVRRSRTRVDKTIISTVDLVTPVTISAYTVLSIPVGALAAITEATNVLAELQSFNATLGVNTFLYDGTGNGSVVLLNGGL